MEKSKSELIQESITNYQHRKKVFTILGTILLVLGILTCLTALIWNMFGALVPIIKLSQENPGVDFKQICADFIKKNHLLMSAIYSLLSAGTIATFGGIAFLIVRSAVCQRMIEKREKQLKALE